MVPRRIGPVMDDLAKLTKTLWKSAAVRRVQELT